LVLEISPIINDNDVLKKITSFTVQYGNSRSNTISFDSQIVTNSVLNQGEWYKFYIDTTGVFRLSKNFLSNLGVNVNSVDPRNIKLYGQGGKPLPLRNECLLSFCFDCVRSSFLR